MTDAFPDQPNTFPLKVNMIGAVPPHWGGGAKWRGGGVASHIQGLLSVLPENSIQVHLLADNTDIAQNPPFPDMSPGITFQAMARSPLDLAHLGMGRMLRLFLQMTRDPVVRRSAPLAQVLRFWGQVVNFDHFLSRSEAEVLHVHRAFNRQFLCQQVLAIPTPMVVTVHSVNALLEPNPMWIGKMLKANYHRAPSMIAVSNYVKNQIVGYGADPNRITVITNGVNISLFSPKPPTLARRELNLPEDGFYILFSGNLIPRKGVDILIQAFSRSAHKNPQAHLYIIGIGNEQDKLTRMTTELGIATQVTFAGYKPFSEMPLWYQACDVFVMPSWAEGLSMSILEAMACGRPVITTKPDVGIHDAVVSGQSGLLAEYGNVEALAHALERLMTGPERTRQMGQAARQMAENKFSWDLIGRQTADVYRLALSQTNQET